MYNDLIQEDILTLDNEFFKINTMFETVDKMYDIKMKELEYNYIYTESINATYIDLYTEAEAAKGEKEQGLLGRLFTAILNFIRKIRAKILRLFGNDKKAAELEAKIKGNSKLANQTVEITNTTDAEKAIDEGVSFFGSLIDKVVKGTATEKDANEAEEKGKSLTARIGIFAGSALLTASGAKIVTEKLGNLFKKEKETEKKAKEITKHTEEITQKGQQSLNNNSQDNNEENIKASRKILVSFKNFTSDVGSFFTGKISQIKSKINSSLSDDDKQSKELPPAKNDKSESKPNKNKEVNEEQKEEKSSQEDQKNNDSKSEKKDNDSEEKSSNTQSSDSKQQDESKKQTEENPSDKTDKSESKPNKNKEVNEEQKEEKSSQEDQKNNDSEEKSSNTQSSDSEQQDESKKQTEENPSDKPNKRTMKVKGKLTGNNKRNRNSKPDKNNNRFWWEDLDEPKEDRQNNDTKSDNPAQNDDDLSPPVIGPGSSKKNDNSQEQSKDDDKKNTNTSNKSSGMLASQVLKRFNEMKKALEDGSATINQYLKVVYNERTKVFDFKNLTSPQYIIDKHSGYVYPNINNSTNMLNGFKDIFMNCKSAIIDDPMKIKLPRVDESDAIISKGEIIDDQTTNESTYNLINNVLTIFENSFK